MSKYGVISGPCFPVFGLNTGKYGPEITPYLDTFHAVIGIVLMIFFSRWFTVMNKYKETEAQNMLICAAVKIKKKIVMH